MDFVEARHIARMSIREVSDYLNISIRTIQRYERSRKAPKSVIECLLMIGGHCPTFARRNDFTGWSFGQGYLWSPDGEKYTSGDVIAGRLALIESNRLFRLSVQQRRDAKKRNTAQVIQFPVTPQVKTNLIK